jgi:hypothetical protein
MPASPKSQPAEIQLARVVFDGHLGVDQVRSKLAGVVADTRASARVGVLVDCKAMTDYDLDARSAFVEWHATMRARLAGVAIVTENPFWHMVIRAMSLAARIEMRPFSTTEAGEHWLRNR